MKCWNKSLKPIRNYQIYSFEWCLGMFIHKQTIKYNRIENKHNCLNSVSISILYWPQLILYVGHIWIPHSYFIKVKKTRQVHTRYRSLFLNNSEAFVSELLETSWINISSVVYTCLPSSWELLYYLQNWTDQLPTPYYKIYHPHVEDGTTYKNQ